MKKGSICIATGLLLIAAALFLTGYNLWDNNRAGKAANETLEQLMPLINPDPIPREGRIASAPSETEKDKKDSAGPLQPEEARDEPMPEVSADEIEYPDYVVNPQMDMPEKKVQNTSYIGVLSIPALRRELPVCGDWNYTALKKTPCRYSGTVYLDNMVICAHNYDIHFGSLKNLSYGDTVIFTDMDGNVFTYQVIEIETLQPTAIEEMTVGDWDLTLFTCTVGGATRVTVRCEKIGT